MAKTITDNWCRGESRDCAGAALDDAHARLSAIQWSHDIFDAHEGSADDAGQHIVSVMRIGSRSLVEGTTAVSAQAEISLDLHAHVTRGVDPTAQFLGLAERWARELLETNGLPIGEIATQVGYDDPSYLARLFRREVGTTPARYRRERRW